MSCEDSSSAISSTSSTNSATITRQSYCVQTTQSQVTLVDKPLNLPTSASADDSTSSATPVRNKKRLLTTSPVQVTDIQPSKKSKPVLSSDYSISDVSNENMDSDNEDATSKVDDDINTHYVSQPMNPDDICKIATELKGLMIPEVSTIVKGQLPDIRDIIADAVRNINENLRAEVSSLRAENTELRDQVRQLEQRVDKAEKAVDSQEQYSRRNCLRISGIVEAPGENTDGIILAVAKDLNVPIQIGDIDRSHRVGKPAACRKILVKFTTYRARQQLYSERRNLSKREAGKNVYINEDLTMARSKLLYDARNLVRAKKISSAYSSDGRIFIKDNNENRHLIESKSALQAFGTVE